MGSRTGPTVPDRATPESRAAGRAAERPRPRNLARSVSYSTPPIAVPCGVLRARQDVQSPDRLLIARARPAAAQQRRGRGQVFGLEEELGEGRMSLVGAAVVEGDLGVAGHLQRAGPGAVVGQRDPPDLGIGIGRDRNLVARLDVCIAAPKDGPVRTEDRLVVVGVSAERLPTGRPGAAAIEVTDVTGPGPSNRPSRPRASASHPLHRSCCIRSRPGSAPRYSGRWTASRRSGARRRLPAPRRLPSAGRGFD